MLLVWGKPRNDAVCIRCRDLQFCKRACIGRSCWIIFVVGFSFVGNAFYVQISIRNRGLEGPMSTDLLTWRTFSQDALSKNSEKWNLIIFDPGLVGWKRGPGGSLLLGFEKKRGTIKKWSMLKTSWFCRRWLLFMSSRKAILIGNLQYFLFLQMFQSTLYRGRRLQSHSLHHLPNWRTMLKVFHIILYPSIKLILSLCKIILWRSSHETNVL